MNYYNENDKRACFWLRELMAAGLIPEGKIDERSVIDVQPADLAGFTQHHFFAGIGGWARALWLACWPAGRPVWTVSCPCQPFSNAGKKKGEADERHLWPKIEQLIRACQPATVFGEQVSSKAGVLWLSRVFADLESLGYQRAGTDLCAAGIGAPHVRQRLFWVAQSGQQSKGWRLHGPRESDATNQSRASGELRRSSLPIGLANSDSERFEGERLHLQQGESRKADPKASGSSETSGLAQPGRVQPEQSTGTGTGSGNPEGGRPSGEPAGCRTPSGGLEHTQIHGHEGCPLRDEGKPQKRTKETNFWADSTWHLCTDGKARRISPEPSVFPLAHGLPGRVALLRGAGNAIVPAVAAEFIKAYLEI